MTVYTGTAANYADLANIIRDSLVLEGWTLEKQRLDPYDDPDPDTEVYHMKGPDITVGSNVVNAHIQFRTRGDFSSDYHNIGFYASTSFEDRSDLGAYQEILNQPGSCATNSQYMTGWNDSTPYWIFINDRRLIVVSKVDTTYSSVYVGFYLPYATPTEMPYPLIVSANSGSQLYRYSQSGYYVGSCANPPELACRLRHFDGTWENVFNYSASNSFSRSATDGSIFPFYRDDHGYTRPMQDGTYILNPCIIYTHNYGGMTYGEFDGLYAVYGVATSSESTFNVDGTDYILFQATNRTGLSDYFAVEMT
jgi:hypothetical protein